MTVKHLPATALPWTIRQDGAERHIDGSSGLGSVACDMRYYPWINTEDMPYIAHSATAYPKLIYALRSSLKDMDATGTDDQAADIRFLLSELGEDE